MAILQIILEILSVLAVASVLIPFIKNDYWTFRIFDYPRFQKFIILIILTIAWFFIFREPNNFQKVLLGLQILCIFYLVYLILPYTFLGKKMIDRTIPKPEEKPLNLLVCNVYQDNTNHAKLCQLIESKDPDIVFLLETDNHWKTGLKKPQINTPIKLKYR